MFLTNPALEGDMRREEMLREAQKQRLIREAQQAKIENSPAFERWMRVLLALILINPR